MVLNNTIATSANVTVKHITWLQTRDGRFVPMIHFDEILLSQMRVNRISGYSTEFIHKHNIAIGKIITVTFVAGVIPLIDMQ